MSFFDEIPDITGQGLQSLPDMKPLFENAYKNNFWFFTPYKSVSSFSSELFAPIYAPLLLGVIAAVLAIAAAVALVFSLGSLLFAFIAYPFDNEMSKDTFAAGIVAGGLGLSSLLIIIAAAIFTLILTPLIFVHSLTRAVATGTNLICGLPADEDPDEEALAYS